MHFLPTPYYTCTASPRVMPRDSFCISLFSEGNPNQVEDNEHHRLKSSKKLLHHCGFHISTQNTSAGRRRIILLRFPVRTSWLGTVFNTEKYKITNRCETARLCPWGSQKSVSLQGELKHRYENHPFQLLRGSFFWFLFCFVFQGRTDSRNCSWEYGDMNWFKGSLMHRFWADRGLS